MGDWTRVAPLADFPPGSRHVVEVEGAQVAVFNLNGGIHAIEDVSTHDGGELASGELEGAEIVCPRH
jgi:3-phenylpropionate/trans-cinnamate dioxygenase ferredoxin subunit